MALCIVGYHTAWETDISILFLSLVSLVVNARNHTRNKISAFAEAGIDKDVRRDVRKAGKGTWGDKKLRETIDEEKKKKKEPSRTKAGRREGTKPG